MGKGVELKSVAFLLDKIFFIRTYQRGYKWDKEQLVDLLNDFKEFIDFEEKHQDEFYCLQPIVIKKLTKSEKKQTKHTLAQSLSEKEIQGNEVYEVIDGQQRITTINLILCYLQNALENVHINFFPKIIYEIRPESSLYLQKFRDKNSFELLKEESVKSVDFFHMYTIYQEISTWFDKYEVYRIKILKLLTSYRANNVRVIWYEVNEKENSIAVFRRFNIGKIPLNNAELIKAILLKDDKEKQPAEKFIISQQWEKFENKLQDVNFWSFLNPPKEYNSRIEYLFDLIFELEVGFKKDDSEYGNDKYNVFRYFDYLVKDSKGDLLTIWDKVSDVFEELNQYYNHPEHYHYLGYLNNEEKKLFKISDLIKTIKKKGSSITDRASLSKHLISLIKKNTKHFFNANGINLSYESKSHDLRNFFLLLNSEITKNLNNSTRKEFPYRYSFNKHNETSFDIEHIGSQTDRDPNNNEEKIEFLRDFYTDYCDIPLTLRNEINVLWIENNKTMEELWCMENIHLDKLKQNFKSLHEGINNLIDEQDKVLDKDSIGNLTLLNSDINRSYGNAFFPTKRRMIIEKDIKGMFIPQGTKNVFLKYYSKDVNKHTRWTQKDIESYKDYLSDLLKVFRTDESI